MAKQDANVILKTYKAQLDRVDQETFAEIDLISRAMIHLWNMGREEALAWLNNSKAVTAYNFNYWLVEKRKEAVTLEDGREVLFKDVSSEVEREVLRKLAGSFSSYFQLKKNKDARARLPGQKEEDWFQTLTWVRASIKGGILSVSGYQRKLLNIVLPIYLIQRVTGKQIVHETISRDRVRGNLQISLVVSLPAPPLKNDDAGAFIRAIDLGASDVAVSDSNGNEFLIPIPRLDKYWRKQVHKIEKRQEKRKKHSGSYESLAQARRMIFEIDQNQQVSFQRKLAHALVEEKVTHLVLGKPKTRLGLAQSGGTPSQHWGVQNTGNMFRQLLFIKEKAQERGVVVIQLPDPKRKGDLQNPQNKLAASRGLLRGELERIGLPEPEKFELKHFLFNRGKGMKAKQ